MTRPNTVPNTVSTALDILSEWGVNFVTNVTTVIRIMMSSDVHEQMNALQKIYSLRDMRAKKSTSGHMSLMTVALNFFRLQPTNRGFLATMADASQSCLLERKNLQRITNDKKYWNLDTETLPQLKADKETRIEKEKLALKWENRVAFKWRRVWIPS